MDMKSQFFKILIYIQNFCFFIYHIIKYLNLKSKFSENGQKNPNPKNRTEPDPKK